MHDPKIRTGETAGATELSHIDAALTAGEGIQPGNELQAAAAGDVLRLAIDLEVANAFPSKDENPVLPANS